MVRLLMPQPLLMGVTLAHSSDRSQPKALCHPGENALRKSSHSSRLEHAQLLQLVLQKGLWSRNRKFNSKREGIFSILPKLLARVFLSKIPDLSTSGRLESSPNLSLYVNCVDPNRNGAQKATMTLCTVMRYFPLHI